jgi:DinB superfamily
MTTFLDETTNLLERTPRVVSALLKGIPDAWTETPDIEGGWRPRDVVGHLITSELDNYLVRAQRIMESGASVPFEPFNRFAHQGRDDDQTLDQLVDRFVELRAANLKRLAELVGDGDLDRHGMHPTLGDVTLRELLSTWAVHDLDHVAQIFAGMAGSHDNDVGPWRINLGILLRREDPAAVPG